MRLNYLIGLLAIVFIFTSCDLFVFNEDEQTLKGGEVYGIWEKNSTITVNGHLIIPEGKSLTIEDNVEVIMNNPSAGLEIIVYGSLYCKGTSRRPILFTVPKSQREQWGFPKAWGGIICAPSAKELLIEYTRVEFTGQVPSENSPSKEAGLYNSDFENGLPAVYFSNHQDGKVVIRKCTFNSIGADCFYFEGGQIIANNNLISTIGENTGDAIVVKSGCTADIGINLFYSPNTNALNLSNEGDRSPQTHVVAYNNTIVNSGWRTAQQQGGGIWLESNVFAELWNNLQVNNRFGTKNNSLSPADSRSSNDYNYYFANTQTGFDGFQSTEKDVIRGMNDLAGESPNDRNPLFENYPVETDVNNINYDTKWDFHPKPGSTLLKGAKTDFVRNFATESITIDGIKYTSPEPPSNFGALGLK
jgi:hypothetical protein